MYHMIEAESHQYEPIDVIIQSEDKTEKLRKQALNELISYKRKYAAILRKINAEDDINRLQMKMENIGA